MAKKLMSPHERTIFAIGCAIKMGVAAIPLFGVDLTNAAWLETNGLVQRVGDDWTLSDAGASAFCRLDLEYGEKPSRAAS
jgi:hypothetical protein